MRRQPVIAAALFLALAGPALPQDAADRVADSIRERLEQWETSGRLAVDDAPLVSGKALPRLYEDNGYRPYWTAERRNALQALLRDSTQDGLTPGDYHLETLARLSTTVGAGADTADPTMRANLDLLATDAFAMLLHDLYLGKVDPQTLDPNWNFERRPLDEERAFAQIEKALSEGRLQEAVAAARPDHWWYARARASLAEYRAIAAHGGWPSILPGPALKVGMAGPRVAALRRRLAATGDLAGAAARGEALRRVPFPRRELVPGAAPPDCGRRGRGLDARRVERARRGANPADTRQSRARARGPARDSVRAPASSWTSPASRSPIFRIRRPSGRPGSRWASPTARRRSSSPRSTTSSSTRRGPCRRRSSRRTSCRPCAATADISRRRTSTFSTATASPSIRRRSTGRTRRRRTFPTSSVKAPGPTTRSGESRSCFRIRTSSICTTRRARRSSRRTSARSAPAASASSRPLELAEKLLDDSKTWNSAAIAQAVADGTTRTVRLPKPVPVLLMYWTIVPSDDGHTVFKRDPYGRDRRLAQALDAPPAAPASGVREDALKMLRSAPAMTAFEGVYSVLPTPFTPGDEIDHTSLRRVIDLALSAGVDGVTALGVTSEAARLSDRERDEVLATVLSHVAGRVPVVAGTTAEGTTLCLERSRAARAAGATAVMVSPPRMPKINSDGVRRHFGALAAAVGAADRRAGLPARLRLCDGAGAPRPDRARDPLGPHDQARGRADAVQDRAHPREGRGAGAQDLRRPRRHVPPRGARGRRDRRDDGFRVSRDPRRDRPPLPFGQERGGRRRLLPERRADALRVPGRHRDGDSQGDAAPPRRDRAAGRAAARRRRSTRRLWLRYRGWSRGSRNPGSDRGPRPEGEGGHGGRRQPRASATRWRVRSPPREPRCRSRRATAARARRPPSAFARRPAPRRSPSPPTSDPPQRSKPGATRRSSGSAASTCSSPTPAGRPPENSPDLDDAAWQSAFELLLLSVIRMVRLAIPSMQGGAAAGRSCSRRRRR